MKKFSPPNMEIIFDVLFVMLFIFASAQSPNIKIDIPFYVWLKDSIIISESIKGEKKHWYNIANHKWENFKNFPSKIRKNDFIIGNINCNKNDFCNKLPSINNEIKKIYIKGDLADEISGLVTDSCLRFPSKCVNVVYYVKKDSTLDREKIKLKNKFFSKIY